MTRTSEYYDSANYLDDELLRGTGVVGLLSGDQLHPPMVDDAEIWKHSARWKEGGAESVRRLLRKAKIRPDDLVLDVGCGIGGATRMLTHEFGARPIGLNISEEQMRTARKLGGQTYLKGNAEQLSCFRLLAPKRRRLASRSDRHFRQLTKIQIKVKKLTGSPHSAAVASSASAWPASRCSSKCWH
ncbi:MAG: SAM-dependent methyltransferase [Gemmatimonadota bacterium]